MKNNIYIFTLIFIILNSSCSKTALESELINEIENKKIQSKGLIRNNCLSNYGFDDVGNPIGGAISGDISYDNIIDKSEANYIVDNLDSLRAVLNNKTITEYVIYIEDNAEIIVNDTIALVIPKGVTLASGRGNNNGSCGALIKTPYHIGKEKPLFKFKGDGGRITGLRIEGPSGEVEVGQPFYKYRMGIRTNGFDYLKIDNNELYNWPYSAITIDSKSTEKIEILNNNFHSNRGKQLGYGAVVGGEGFALIKGNRFYQNRHDIGSSGVRGSGYEASYNYVESYDQSYGNFDVHGTTESHDAVAGHFTYIHHNIFKQKTDNIIIRGIPNLMCLIEDNKFAAVNMNQAISHKVLINETNDRMLYRGNLFAWNNIYDWDEVNGNYKELYITKEWNKKENSITILQPFYRKSSDKRRTIREPRPASPKPFDQDIMMDFELGNFDNDQQTEIFVSVNGNWFIADLPTPNNYSGYRDWEWKKINSSDKLVEQLGFGDFNGDGITDVLNANGKDWYVSYGGNSGWSLLNSNTTTKLNKLRFGDFNGDGKIDIFKANSEGWHVSYGGGSTWTRINSSGKSVEQLGFGDFDGNGTTDVFNANGKDWYVSYGGNSGWQHLKAYGETIDKLFFGTFNNSGIIGGKTNIFTNNHAYYQIAESPSYIWTPLIFE